MRLGEFRTKTRDLDNKLIICLSNYQDNQYNIVEELDLDMCTDNKIFLRIINNEEKING